MIDKLSELVGIESSDVSANSPLTDYGVDSLAAVELATWLKNELHISTSQMEILGGITISQLVARIGEANDEMGEDVEEDLSE